MMRVFRVSALILTTVIGLVAGMLVLDPFHLLSSGADGQDLPKESSQRTAYSPLIIIRKSIDAEPASRAPLLIEVGPPEWVPRDGTLYLEGLPEAISLSQGHRVSENLWAVSVGDLSNIKIEVAPNTSGRSDVAITLKAADGSLLAATRTAISIIAPTTAAADETAKASSPVGSDQRAHLTPGSVSSEALSAAGSASGKASADAQRSASAPAANEKPSDPTVAFAAAREMPAGSGELLASAIIPPTNPSAEPDSSREDKTKAPSPPERDVIDGRDSALQDVTGREADGHGQQPVGHVSLASSEAAQCLDEARRIEEVLTQAARRVTTGNVKEAREMLAAVGDRRQGLVTFALAETYDPNMLAAWGVRGISSDVVKAKSLYRRALELGIARAHTRLEALE